MSPMTLARPTVPMVDRPDGSDSVVVLPSGRLFDLHRTRWDGVLSAEELAYCRASGIALGYDTAQIGWVLLNSDPAAAPLDSGTGRPSTGSQPPPVSRPSSGIVFRRWTDHDVPAHRALLGDPSVWEQLPEPYPDPFTHDTSTDLIALANADLGHDVLAVEVDGELVGQCLLRFDHPTARRHTAEVAYWLGRDHWGHGVMSRVLPAFIGRCFHAHPVDEAYAWIRPTNIASSRVAERSGFRRDLIPNEAALAAASGRTGFLRWTIRRPTAVAAKHLP